MAPLTIPAPQTSLLPPSVTDPSITHVRDTISQIKLVANRIIDLRSHVQLSEDESRRLQTDEKKLTNLKIMLRGFNREMHLQNRAVKTATSEAKAQVDNLYLNLQNLKYEQQHLRSEIQDCRNYAYYGFVFMHLTVERCIRNWIWLVRTNFLLCIRNIRDLKDMN